MSDIIKQNFLDALNLMQTFMHDEVAMASIHLAGDCMVKSLQNTGKIISCGNGGSMADAMHFAEELTGRFREDRPSMAAIAIADPTHITCVGNDYGFDFIFSRFVEGAGNPNDVLLAISTSGNSPNVINAARSAKEKGMKVVALTGKNGGKLADLCDIEIRVPWDGFADRIQEIHIKIIHSLIQYIESKMLKNDKMV